MTSTNLVFEEVEGDALGFFGLISCCNGAD